MKVFINENIVYPGDTWIPIDKQTFDDNLDTIVKCISCFGLFNECELYYNGEGIRDLIEKLDWVNNTERYNSSDIIAAFRRVISKYEIIDWSENKLHRDDFYYIVQINAGLETLPIKDNSIAEACENSIYGTKSVLLNFVDSKFNASELINVNRVDINSPDKMQIVSIDSICAKKNSIQYYLKKRNPIEFRPNEEKHGENHNVIRYDTKCNPISPLKCLNTEAAELLKIAISSKKSNELYAFDSHPGRNEFIEFKSEDRSENTQNPKGYHGYHPHDQKIPNDVKKFLNENKKIFETLKNSE